MPLDATVVAGALVVVGGGVLGLYGWRLAKAWLRYRGTRIVACPESGDLVAVAVDAPHAALSGAARAPELRLESCTRWPERAGCGQECLDQIEAAPEACLLRAILSDWYAARSCVLCGRPFHALHWHDHEPGLLGPGGDVRGATDFPPERVADVLATHAPLCFDCRVAESFRREHPELVTDRPAPRTRPPSMA